MHMVKVLNGEKMFHFLVNPLIRPSPRSPSGLCFFSSEAATEQPPLCFVQRSVNTQIYTLYILHISNHVDLPILFNSRIEYHRIGLIAYLALLILINSRFCSFVISSNAATSYKSFSALMFKLM